MTIDAHILAFNEAEIIRLTVQHYKSFCRRVIIYDNHSTDDTRDIAIAAGAEVQLFGIPGQLDDREYLKVKNHCWKGGDADYVIVCDTDEILYHPIISNFDYGMQDVFDTPVMALQGNPTIFNTQGFSIWDNDVPRRTLLELTKGVLDDAYSKKILFSPKLEEIGYVYGCHECNPKGRIVYGNTKFAVLHYHNIGGVERVIRRHAMYEQRRSEHNRRWGMGRQYAETPEFKRKEWNEYYARRVELSQAGIW